MGQAVVEAGSYLQITASTQVATGPGKLIGIFVAVASSTPTLQVADNISATTPSVIATFTPVAGTFYPIPAQYKLGVFVTLSGTVTCTVFYDTSGT